MRRKKEAVLTFEWNNDHLPKTVREYREKYKGISRLLDANPEILDRVHKDLKKLSQGGREGREADFTSETILRALNELPNVSRFGGGGGRVNESPLPRAATHSGHIDRVHDDLSGMAPDVIGMTAQHDGSGRFGQC